MTVKATAKGSKVAKPRATAKGDVQAPKAPKVDASKQRDCQTLLDSVTGILEARHNMGLILEKVGAACRWTLGFTEASRQYFGASILPSLVSILDAKKDDPMYQRRRTLEGRYSQVKPQEFKAPRAPRTPEPEAPKVEKKMEAPSADFLLHLENPKGEKMEAFSDFFALLPQVYAHVDARFHLLTQLEILRKEYEKKAK